MHLGDGLGRAASIAAATALIVVGSVLLSSPLSRFVSPPGRPTIPDMSSGPDVNAWALRRHQAIWRQGPR